MNDKDKLKELKEHKKSFKDMFRILNLKLLFSDKFIDKFNDIIKNHGFKMDDANLFNAEHMLINK
jgi:hypothetical protein